MSKAVIFFAPGFEECEGLIVVDLLRRADGAGRSGSAREQTRDLLPWLRDRPRRRGIHRRRDRLRRQYHHRLRSRGGDPVRVGDHPVSGGARRRGDEAQGDRIPPLIRHTENHHKSRGLPSCLLY